MDKNERKELKKVFKKCKDRIFLLSDKDAVFIWDDEDGIPDDKIYIGRHGEPTPELTLSPYDIEKIEYTKPGLFREGLLKVIGPDSTILYVNTFKYKDNIKTAEKFNECLRLYKQYNLGKE